MRIKEGFELVTICGVDVIVAHGRENMDFSKIISLNESAAYLWKAVINSEFDEARLADLLCQEYEVSREEALRDVGKMVEEWKSVGLIEG